jgi:hypothetical protein
VPILTPISWIAPGSPRSARVAVSVVHSPATSAVSAVLAHVQSSPVLMKICAMNPSASAGA